MKGCSFIYLRNCIFCPLPLSVIFIVSITSTILLSFFDWLKDSALYSLEKALYYRLSLLSWFYYYYYYYHWYYYCYVMTVRVNARACVLKDNPLMNLCAILSCMAIPFKIHVEDKETNYQTVDVSPKRWKEDKLLQREKVNLTLMVAVTLFRITIMGPYIEIHKTRFCSILPKCISTDIIPVLQFRSFR